MRILENEGVTTKCNSLSFFVFISENCLKTHIEYSDFTRLIIKQEREAATEEVMREIEQFDLENQPKNKGKKKRKDV